MNKTIPIILSSATLMSQAAEITLHAQTIPAGDYSVTPFTTADSNLSIFESTGAWSTGGTSPTSFGGSGSAGNANAFDQVDQGTLSLQFSPTSGLRTFVTIWSTATITITGFLGDPGVTITGGTGATASYNAGTVTLSQPWNAATTISYQFANPAASAGQTLDFAFAPNAGATNANYQLALNRIVYEDAIPTIAPVITTGLPENTNAVLDLPFTLSVGVAGETFPAPSYTWELLNGPSPVFLSSDPAYQFTPSNSDAGTYRVTVSNSAGSVSSTTNLTVVDDSDNLDNQWELDFFGDITSYDENDDVEPDGLTNAQEYLLGTDPTNSDTDSDGVSDSAENKTGVFVSDTNAGTNPLGDTDSDGDGWIDSYEVLNGPTNPFDPSTPAATSISGFAISFDSTAGYGGSLDIPFTGLVAAGANGVSQKNWNRTANIANPLAQVTGGVNAISTPTPGRLVDASGIEIGDGSAGTGFTYTGGAGAFSYVSDPITPYGRLFNAFLYGNAASPEVSVSLTNIPYSTYDVYVYFGSDTNGRRGTITSTTAGETYSFTTASNPAQAGGVGATYVRTTDTASAFPAANFARFEAQTSSDFQVATTWGQGGGNLGIFGVQVIDTSSRLIFQLSNPLRNGANFSALLTTTFGGTFILERSQSLTGTWTQIGEPFTHQAGAITVTDSTAPAGRAFYRVRVPSP